MTLNKIELDHADIVITHFCNMKCPACIDKFRGKDPDKLVSIHDISVFLDKLRLHTNKPMEILLLGGEPLSAPVEYLKEVAHTISDKGFTPIVSTNGLYKDKIHELLPLFRWIQITIHSEKDIEYWRSYKDHINIKLSGDKNLTYKKLMSFIAATEDFERRSVSMYFTPEFEELCKDKEIWELLNTLDWKRNGSYLYAFYQGVRFKKGIPGETNIIDEPTVSKLYPNGNYNKTWCNEDMDAYLG